MKSFPSIVAGKCTVAFVCVLAASVGQAQDQPKVLPAKPLASDVLDHLQQLAPTERLRFLEKLPAKERPYVAAAKGAVTPTVVERGTLQAVKSTAIYCTIKATMKGSPVAGVIRWVVDDGTHVKKGDKLIEFDNSPLRERAKDLKGAIAQAEAGLVKATEHLAEIERENAIDIKLAEVDVKLADLARRQYTGNDAVQKDILALKVDRQILLLERLRSTARAKSAQAAAERDVKKAIHEQELARLRDLEGEGAKHIVHAPHDGFVAYYVPEQSRFGAGPQSIVAQGEPVREGQKLLLVSDLKQMAVLTRIHEAVISKVRAGQKATVRVDAFPGKVETGKVTEVATVADQSSFFSKDVKVYQVVIAIDGENKNMKPGMSAEIKITLADKADCIRIPVTAIVSIGKNRGCFIAVDNELQLRRANFGLADANFIEVVDGIKEGEMVLTDPHAVAVRLAVKLGGGKQPEKGKFKPTQIRIRSVKPKDDGKQSKLMSRYGLLHEDFERLALLEHVVSIVPVRSFPYEVRRLERVHVGHVMGTTAAFAEAHALKLDVGRFLGDADELERHDVAVLGAAAAERLFPNAESVGQTIVLNKHLYKVVGVLGKMTANDPQVNRINDAVFIPLACCRSQFGERIFYQESGKRHAEEVQLNEILITLHDASRVGATLDAIRDLLEKAHKTRDWEIHVGSSETR